MFEGIGKIDRRRLLSSGVAAGAGLWLNGLVRGAAAANATGQRKRSVILLWLGGGPSQIDTFDPKPNHENGGQFSAIDTVVPGLQLSENFPLLAQQADKIRVVRSVTSKEGDHSRGTHLLRTGFSPGGPAKKPPVTSAIGKVLSESESTLPPAVSIGGYSFLGGHPLGPSYLGPKFTALRVRESTSVPSTSSGGGNGNVTFANGPLAELRVESLDRPDEITDLRDQRRMKLWRELQGRFVESHAGTSVESHRAVYEDARTLLSGGEAGAFDLSEEAEDVRRAYGRGVFGQGCLLARRLVERGVPVVEVALDRATIGGHSWDTHSNNFEAVGRLSRELDAGFASLVQDLSQRGLLGSTSIICIGEFGRTPTINGSTGRDHFPRAFSAVLAGGSIESGGVYGETSEDGNKIVTDPVAVTSLLATVCSSIGVDPRSTVIDEFGRPVPIVDADPIPELLA